MIINKCYICNQVQGLQLSGDPPSPSLSILSGFVTVWQLACIHTFWWRKGWAKLCSYKNFQGGQGLQKPVKFLKESIWSETGICRGVGWGSNQKPFMKRYGYFLDQHILLASSNELLDFFSHFLTVKICNTSSIKFKFCLVLLFLGCVRSFSQGKDHWHKELWNRFGYRNRQICGGINYWNSTGKISYSQVIASEWFCEDCTRRIWAWSLDCIDWVQQGLYKKDQGLIFS